MGYAEVAVFNRYRSYNEKTQFNPLKDNQAENLYNHFANHFLKLFRNAQDTHPTEWIRALASPVSTDHTDSKSKCLSPNVKHFQ